MKKKKEKVKYTPLNLPETTVNDLKLWNKAYKLVKGDNFTLDKMIQDMIKCNRKFKWWRKVDKEVIMNYEAFRLADYKNISFDEAKEIVDIADDDSTISNRKKSYYEIISTMERSHHILSTNYKWDKDYLDIDTYYIDDEPIEKGWDD